MTIYTIYNSPSDYVGKVVVRAWQVGRTGLSPRQEAFICDTLEEARMNVPPGYSRVERSPEDDPVIMETWI